MKNLIVVCEDSFALDIKEIIISINDYWEEHSWGIPYSIKGFISPNNDIDELVSNNLHFLGKYEDWVPSGNDYHVMGVRDPQHKKEAVEFLKAKGAVFETLWAPWVMASLDFKFPEGCVIAAQSVMDSAVIGSFVTLFHSMVGFDAVVGDYSSVLAYANITTAHIGKCVYIADNSVVMGKNIHDNARVLYGSVVVKDVKSGVTVSGIPAKIVKESV